MSLNDIPEMFLIISLFKKNVKLVLRVLEIFDFMF